jgi:hypothetical protein
MSKQDTIPAIPPEDYKGTISGWMIALIERNLWNGEDPEWYGDIELPAHLYWEILEEQEKGL